MPPYEPVKSKAQSRALFAAAERGEISEEDAREKTRAADWKSLPERVGSRSSGRRTISGKPVHKRARKPARKGPNRAR